MKQEDAAAHEPSLGSIATAVAGARPALFVHAPVPPDRAAGGRPQRPVLTGATPSPERSRMEERLWLLFWERAERHGTVHTDGVHIGLRLTHEVLSQLAAARRPS